MTAIAYGKEVHVDGAPVCQGNSEAHAAMIVEALNARESIAAYLDTEARNKLRTKHVRQVLRAIAGNVRAGLDRDEGEQQ